MPAITLSQFTFRPPSPSSSLKSVPTCLVSLSSPCRKLSSKLSLHESVPVLFRFSSGCQATTRKERYWRKSEVVSKYYDRQELRRRDFCSCELSTRSVTVMDNPWAFEKSLAKGIHKNIDNHESSSAVSSSVLKFMLLSGFFILQNSQQALAGSDVATGLQSVPLLGDLGDISTGVFANLFLRTRGQDFFHCSSSSS